MEKIALTVKEAAEVLGISEDAVYRMIYRGELPHNRINGRGRKGKGKILISKKALEEWLMGENNRTNTRKYLKCVK